MSTDLKNTIALVAPWGIQADHPRFCDLLIQSIPGCRLRSTLNGMKGAIDRKTGDSRTPIDQSRHLASMPIVPGHILTVFPTDRRYTITDPIRGNDAMLGKISRFLAEQDGIRANKNFEGTPDQEGTLDFHQMKTLNREMFNIVASGEAKVVVGKCPTMIDIEELAGYFLLNPGSRVGSGQPVYEKDFDQWKEGLSRRG